LSGWEPDTQTGAKIFKQSCRETFGEDINILVARRGKNECRGTRMRVGRGGHGFIRELGFIEGDVAGYNAFVGFKVKASKTMMVTVVPGPPVPENPPLKGIQSLIELY
nr:hypothetical protein [Tanacetum cinerariifolium]